MDHRRHDVVPLMDENERKKKDLEETEAYTQQLILERQTKIEQVNQSVKLSKVDTDREKANSIRVFDSLIQSAEAALVQLIEIIEESQKTAEKQAEGFIKELKEEIDKLMKRSSEMKQLFHSKDHNQLLQNSSSLILAVPTKDWSDIRICSSLVGNINAAETRLGVALNKEIKKMFITVEAKRVQQYAVDVTLDPETASESVTLSEDGKRVKSGHTQKFKDGPRRCRNGVLGKQKFSSGKFYFEVLVEGKNNWVLGVVKELASRKYYYEYNTSNGFWTLRLTEKNKYEAADSKNPIDVTTSPEKVGVYVSYEEKLVSFYDVDNAQLIYSITDCKFDEEVYPYLNPGHDFKGQNFAPLIICPVRAQQIK
uniref:B30.2/SPRY domain-containing protein n=1 Tax=Nothobranchius kuhntae TaxID=321403 RepID=A0A1A8IPR8_NOTKU